MADFIKAFEATIKAEGGYVNDPDDAGGETYKGIARTRNENWKGWEKIDFLKKNGNFPDNLEADKELQECVSDLYESEYWNKICGDKILDQDVAESIFDFAVNGGVKTSSKLAQKAVDATPDGIIGPRTLKKINAEDKKTFLAVFALSKIARYVDICEKRKDNRKYFFGWVRRTLKKK